MVRNHSASRKKGDVAPSLGETVIKHALICVLTVVMFAAGAAAQRVGDATSSGDQFIGTWSGRWDGSGSGGGFDLTIDKGRENALAARVSVTGEPTYKATLKKLSFDGNKMTGAYDFTPDEAGEVILAATFEGNAAKGTWSLRSKADGAEVASGTWTVTKK
jgi:hypothetical protein